MLAMLEEYINQVKPEIEDAIEAALPKKDAYPAVIHEAMRYSTTGGGKRLRAMLILATCEMLEGNRPAALQAGAAIEMLHAYSLVHDDLPCMDDDDLRRGKPTNHKVFGEGIAVLTGDALLTEAFAHLARLPKWNVPPETTVQIVQEVATAASSRGLIGGQVVDLQSEGKPISERTLRYIHSHKTGALFRACVRVGGWLGDATPEEMRALTGFAEEFGLAFQIVDDILDVVGQTEELGKAVGSDEAHHKATYPARYGLERSRKMAQECVDRAGKILARFGEGNERLLQLATYVVERSS